MIHGRRDFDSFGCAAEKVAQAVREFLQSIYWAQARLDFFMEGSELIAGEDFVPEDHVMSRAGGAVKSVVRLEEEIPSAWFGDAAIYDKASLEIAGVLLD